MTETTVESKAKEITGNVAERRFQTIYRNTIDNFGKHLIGRVLSIELTNNKIYNGKLKSFGQYDIILTDSRTGQDAIIMKSAIVTIQGDISPRQ